MKSGFIVENSFKFHDNLIKSFATFVTNKFDGWKILLYLHENTDQQHSLR